MPHTSHLKRENRVKQRTGSLCGSKLARSFLGKNTLGLYIDRAGDEDERKARKKKAASKTKFVCPTCDLNAWAKPTASLTCTTCQEEMEEEEPEEDE